MFLIGVSFSSDLERPGVSTFSFFYFGGIMFLAGVSFGYDLGRAGVSTF